MHGIIVVNAYVRNPSQISQAKRLREEFFKLGHEADIVKNIGLVSVSNGAVTPVDAEFCVFSDKDKVACELLEKSGVRVFNSAKAIEVCDNKMLTHTALAGSGIPMPDCVYAPLCYYEDVKADDTFVSYVLERLGLPLVAKMSYGSLGNEVWMINSPEELKSFEEKNKLFEHFYQKYIFCGKGRDVRCLVVGGKFLCSYARVNDTDFRSNIEQGGRGERFDASSDIVEFSEKAAITLGLDYCGTDILISESGEKYLCEVNSNAFFRVAEKVTGVNVARAFAEHVIASL
ncbi:MAG: RimK family alpha-L-glutamate ligase [Clostridia bacterium]|nr:RimK family alpha-L-glutamate ligase [Clostridia bacterium]